MLVCKSDTGIRLGQNFTFAVNMEGSQQRPDSDFEMLVKTYIKMELRKLPDVRVVPEGDEELYLLNFAKAGGREFRFPAGRDTTLAPKF